MSPLASAARARILTAILAQITPAVTEFLDYVEAHPAAPFPALEAAAVRASQAVFAPALATLLAEQRPLVEARPPPCAWGRPRHSKAPPPRTLLTRLGPLTFRRGYYYCAACRPGAYPPPLPTLAFHYPYV